MSLSRSLLLVYLLSHIPLCLANDAPPPMPADIQSAYKQNFLTITPLRLVWTQSAIQSDLHERRIRRNLAATALLLEQDGLSEAARADLLQSQSIDESTLKWRARESIITTEFWTDGRQFQVRIPHKSDDSSDGAASGATAVFPKVPLSRESLTSSFSNVSIISRSESDGTATFIRWSGVSNGVPRGVLSTSPMAFEPAGFPPLGIMRGDWGGEAMWHSLDVLFSKPPDQFTVLGYENVSGRNLLKIEHRVDTFIEPASASTALPPGDDKVIRQRYSLAWVDPAQGFLPLQIHSGKRYLYRGKELNAGHAAPDVELEVLKVQRFGTGYYPIQGVVKVFENDDLQPGQVGPTLADFANGVTFDYPRALSETKEWKVEELQQFESLDSAMFAFSFPSKTRYFDGRANRSMIVGMSPEQLDQETAQKFPLTAPKSLKRNVAGQTFWLLYVNSIALVLIVLALVARKRWRSHK